MAITPGTHLGPYEILGPLGAGGMGEVYRARDTKLGRDVALKVLPPAFIADADRVARFEREARLLASLNHPHVGAIYGFEDSGEVPALVLELVEGETLDDRLSRGPLSLSDALTVAHQIADALDAAHGSGIIHRDLKPSNIKITPDGGLKVLDFGLPEQARGEALPGCSAASPWRRPPSPAGCCGWHPLKCPHLSCNSNDSQISSGWRGRPRFRRTARPWPSWRGRGASVRSGSGCWPEARPCRSPVTMWTTSSRVGRRIPVPSSITFLGPVLSPDGKLLAMPLSDGGTSNIWAQPTDGGPMRPLTDFGNRAIVIRRRVSWSRDSKFLYSAVADTDADIVLLAGLLR